MNTWRADKAANCPFFGVFMATKTAISHIRGASFADEVGSCALQGAAVHKV